MKKALILILAAFMIPSVALAAKPTHNPKAPQVVYSIQGTLSDYTPYDSVTPANGSITIVVNHINKAGHKLGKALKGQSLTFAVDQNTRIWFAQGVTAITNGDRGNIKIRAAKKIAPADLAATLQASPARQIHDRGVKPAH